MEPESSAKSRDFSPGVASSSDEKKPSIAVRRHAEGLLHDGLESIRPTDEEFGVSPKKFFSPDSRIGTTTTPHSLGHTRETTIALLPGLLKYSPHVPDYRESILDSLLRRLGFLKHVTQPDKFEEFLRSKDEITLADVYRWLSEKPAWKFKNLFSWRIMGSECFDLHHGSKAPLHYPSYDGTLSDLFGRAEVEFHTAGLDTVSLRYILYTIV
jgi:hypothetical protein